MPADTNSTTATAVRDIPTLPISYVPTPTEEYRSHRKLVRATVEPGAPPAPTGIPAAPPSPGARALIWKQDPSVTEIGIRKIFLPYAVLPGPRDARRQRGAGDPPGQPKRHGRLHHHPGHGRLRRHPYVRGRPPDAHHVPAGPERPAALAVEYWRQYGPLQVFPHGLPNTINAFYSRTQKALKFGDFIKPGEPPTSPRIFTCRPFDIVSHEAGHAVLDGLKPSWILIGNPPQTGGLHEAFGDLTAIFLALSQLDQVDAIIAQTKADLHDKTFLADLAEQFGLALGKPNGLRNADNDFKLSEVGTEVHAISQVFTGAIYDILADIFTFERDPVQRDDAAVLYAVGQYVCSLVLRAIRQAPATAATYAHVANLMLQIAAADGKPVQYRTFIRNRFSVREVVVSPTPLTEDLAAGLELAPAVQDAPGAVQDRSRCCGTMQHPEHMGVYEAVERELAELRKVFV